MTLHHDVVVDFADTARITRMAVVHLVLTLITGHARLGGVDDDHVITTVQIGRILRLVFAAQNLGGLHRDAAQNLVLGVDEDPLFRYFALLGDIGLHVQLPPDPLMRRSTASTPENERRIIATDEECVKLLTASL
jgi:hypothetical protein